MYSQIYEYLIDLLIHLIFFLSYFHKEQELNPLFFIFRLFHS